MNDTLFNKVNFSVMEEKMSVASGRELKASYYSDIS